MASLIRDLAASSPEMLAVFSDETLIRAALDFEIALARAEAAEGLMTQDDAAAIASACENLPIDIRSLAEEATHAGTLAIPLVRRIRAEVARHSESAAGKVHLGGTSQDLADTALMLQAKAGTALIARELDRMCGALDRLTETHAATPMLGRTLLQAARPITFGLKTVGWLIAVDDALRRVRTESEIALCLQFGGATGSLAGLQGKAFEIGARLAQDLGLADPILPWQARRNGIAGLAGALAIATGAVGKIARDISLMAQTEVAEAFEPRIDGRGGSSAMAHKRNPTGCQIALSAALRTPGLAAAIMSALPQEHERGLGGWQSEGPVLAELFNLTHGAVLAMADVLDGLEIEPETMLRNLIQADVGLDSGESGTLAHRALAQYRGI